jgi:hypothetical protein
VEKQEWGADRYAVVKKRPTDNLRDFMAEQIIKKTPSMKYI